MSGLWLKAITCYSLTDFPKLSVAELEDALSAQRFTPCGELDRERHGFTPAFEQQTLVRKTDDVLWLQVMSEKKPVPGKVVKRLLAERVAKIEKEEVRKVGKKEKKDLKEMVIDELVAKAHPVQSTVTVMIDLKAQRLLVGAVSNKICELVMSLMLRCIDGFAPKRMEFGAKVTKQMANLLLDEDTSQFETDSSLVLKGPGTPATTVSFAKHSLASNQIIAHMNAGLRPVSLEMSLGQRVSFVLTDTFGIKRINYLDLVTSEFESAKPEDADELTDAILLVQVGELRKVIDGLLMWVGQAPDEEEAPATAEMKEAA